MNSIQKRFMLFLGICIPTRLLIAYISSKLTGNYLKLLGIIAIFPALGWLYIYKYNLRKTGVEVFGDKIWWNSLRPIHAINYLAFSYFAINNKKNANIFLYIDVFIGLFFFLTHHFL